MTVGSGSLMWIEGPWLFSTWTVSKRNLRDGRMVIRTAVGRECLSAVKNLAEDATRPAGTQFVANGPISVVCSEFMLSSPSLIRRPGCTFARAVDWDTQRQLSIS